MDRKGGWVAQWRARRRDEREQERERERLRQAGIDEILAEYPVDRPRVTSSPSLGNGWSAGDLGSGFSGGDSDMGGLFSDLLSGDWGDVGGW